MNTGIRKVLSRSNGKKGMVAVAQVFLSCLVLLCFCSLASASTELYDAVIVGAGWSGLTAANYLLEAGITENFLVIEARDRIGGRSHTQVGTFEDGFAVELGSGWIYPDTNVAELAEKLGFEQDTRRIDWTWNTFAMFDSDGELSAEDKSSTIDDIYLDEFVKYAERRASINVNLFDIKKDFFADHEYLTDHERHGLEALINAEISVGFGSPLNETNSELTVEYLTYESELVSLPEGTGELAKRLAEPFEEKIMKDTAVVKIDQGGDVVEIFTADNKVIYARSVILTVPLGVLKHSVIEFVPPLPDSKLEAIDMLGMGCTNKVVMYWDKASQDISWWPTNQTELQLITDDASKSGDWTYFYNDQTHTANEDYYVLTSWSGGDVCDRLEKNTDEETMDTIVGNLRTMFGNDSLPAPAQYVRTNWRSDEFTYGSYSYDAMGDDATEYRERLSETFGSIFFAGEATDTEGWYSTIVGAYTTGVRAAARVDRSEILEAPPPDFQPTCAPIGASCGEEGPFALECCSGSTCQYNAKDLVSIPSNETDTTIGRSIEKVCSPVQRKRRRRQRRRF